jgi:hypothetical protein
MSLVLTGGQRGEPGVFHASAGRGFEVELPSIAAARRGREELSPVPARHQLVS